MCKITRGKTCLESGEGVGSNVESGNFDVLKEIVKVLRVEEDFGQSLVPGAFS